ncbi:MAG: S1 RNA-binding domain-containing protein, partial [Candidatus Omnitrophica bacterium]|nr:S1 RNA-binding domain-containing protein [Candidatus Omnitrophota bacterium]
MTTAAPDAGQQLADLYEQSMRGITQGQIVKGRIVALTPQEVIVDIGFKSEGAVNRLEFPEPETLKVGDEVEVLVDNIEDEQG